MEVASTILTVTVHSFLCCVLPRGKFSPTWVMKWKCLRSFEGGVGGSINLTARKYASKLPMMSLSSNLLQCKIHLFNGADKRDNIRCIDFFAGGRRIGQPSGVRLNANFIRVDSLHCPNRPDGTKSSSFTD